MWVIWYFSVLRGQGSPDQGHELQEEGHRQGVHQDIVTNTKRTNTETDTINSLLQFTIFNYFYLAKMKAVSYFWAWTGQVIQILRQDSATPLKLRTTEVTMESERHRSFTECSLKRSLVK